MYHSIIFANSIEEANAGKYKNTWDDWGLIPSSRPIFSAPSPKTVYSDIVGGDGSFDFTEYVSNRVTYNNRIGSLDFIFPNASGIWPSRYSEILNFLHGQSKIAILEDDKEYYYSGRFSISKWDSEEYYTTLRMDYNVFPYKRERYSSADEWLWDYLNFTTGIIKNLWNISVNGTTSVQLPPSDEQVTPIINCSRAMSVSFNGKSYSLKAGDNTISDIVLWKDWITLTFSGTGTVVVNYRGGSL